MARQRTISVDEETFEPLPRRRRSRRRRARRLAVWALLSAIACAIAAPQILGSKLVRPWVLGRIVPAASGRLECSRAALSWTGGQRLDDIRLTDATGAVLMEARSASCGRSLVGLLTNPHNLGRISIERPAANWEAHAEGSNWEWFLADWRSAQRLSVSSPTADDAASRPATTTFELALVDGSVNGRDVTTGQAWRLADVAISAIYRGAWTANPGIWQASGQATATTPDERGGWTAPLGSLRWSVQPAAGNGSQMEVLCDRFPLAPLAPLLAVWQPGVRLSGVASADLQARADVSGANPIGLAIAGRANIADARYSAGQLQGETVRIDRGELEIDAQWANRLLQAKTFRFESEWIDARWQGTIRADGTAPGHWNALVDETESFSGRVDLAALTRMLPRTLQLRPGVTIETGTAEVSLHKGEAPAERGADGAWRIAGSIANLHGSDGQHAIRWHEAVEIAAEATPTPRGPQLQRARIRSPFLSVALESTPAGYKGETQFDFDRVQDQLGQVVDLSPWRLAGTGNGNFQIISVDGNRWRCTARLDAQNLRVARDRQTIWHDPAVRCDVTAEAALRNFRPVRIEQGLVAVSSPQQSVRVELLAGLDLDPTPSREFHLRFEGSGPLEAWRSRWSAWQAVPPRVGTESDAQAPARPLRRLAGQAQVRGELHGTPQALAIESFDASATDLELTLADVAIHEPQVALRGTLRYDRVNGDVASQGFTWQGSALSLQARDVAWRAGGPRNAALRGEAAFRGDLERLSSWFGMHRAASAGWPRGKALGTLRFVTENAGIRGDVTATCEPCEWALPTQSQVAWSEPRLEAQATISYDRGPSRTDGVEAAQDRIVLNPLRIHGQTLEVNGITTIENVSTTRRIDSQLTLKADEQAIAVWTRRWLGDGVSIRGLTTGRMIAAGQLGPPSLASLASAATPRAASPAAPPQTLIDHWSRSWEIQAETSLQGGTIFGLPIGATRLAASLVDGVVPFEPIEAPTRGGRIMMRPRITLAASAPQFELPAGPLATRVEISPAVSEAMLKYAAPMLAGATHSEGTFSLDIDGLTMPLQDRRKTKAAGRLAIHRLSVAPGPLLYDLTTLVQQIDALTQGPGAPPGGAARAVQGLTVNENTVDFQIVDGRVFHRGLEFLVDDVPVRSYGSVGFDDTLALVIEVPIQEKWVRRQRALQPLAGRMLEIPVGGTFAQPRLERRALTDLSRQVVQSAAEQYIGDEIHRALDRLLKPK